MVIVKTITAGVHKVHLDRQESQKHGTYLDRSDNKDLYLYFIQNILSQAYLNYIRMAYACIQVSAYACIQNLQKACMHKKQRTMHATSPTFLISASKHCLTFSR